MKKKTCPNCLKTFTTKMFLTPTGRVGRYCKHCLKTKTLVNISSLRSYYKRKLADPESVRKYEREKKRAYRLKIKLREAV